MLTKCKFMFVLCDVSGRSEVLGSAAVFNLFVSAGVSETLWYFYLTKLHISGVDFDIMPYSVIFFLIFQL